MRLLLFSLLLLSAAALSSTSSTTTKLTLFGGYYLLTKVKMNKLGRRNTIIGMIFLFRPLRNNAQENLTLSQGQLKRGRRTGAQSP